MQLDEMRAHRRSRLEQIRSNGRRLEPRHQRHLDRLVTLQVDEIEDLSLPRRQPLEVRTHRLGDLLPVHPRPRVGEVHLALGLSGWEQPESIPPARAALPLCRRIPHDAIEPGLQRRIAAKGAELPVHLDEGFLGHVVGFVGIVGKGERPPCTTGSNAVTSAVNASALPPAARARNCDWVRSRGAGMCPFAGVPF